MCCIHHINIDFPDIHYTYNYRALNINDFIYKLSQLKMNYWWEYRIKLIVIQLLEILELVTELSIMI